MGSSGFPLQPEPTLELMMSNFLLLVTLATLATAIPVEVENTETKASSPLINCGCQCSSLTFRDANGVVQGNCLTVDSTGAQWCYVDQAYSSCQDLVPSSVGPVETVGPTIQEIFGANGGYDPESIGEPRQGDASSKINLPGLE